MGNSGASCCEHVNSDDHVRTFKQANDKPDQNIFSLKSDNGLFLCSRPAEKVIPPVLPLARPQRLDQIFPEANAIQAYFLEKIEGSDSSHNIIEADMEFEVGSNVFAVLISCLHEAVDDDNLQGVKDVLGASTKRNLHKDWINSADPDGNTCLHKAAWRGNLNILWLLLQHGSDPTATNRNGKNPIEFATVRKNFECRHLLLKFQRERAGPGSGTPSATPGTPRGGGGSATPRAALGLSQDRIGFGSPQRPTVPFAGGGGGGWVTPRR